MLDFILSFKRPNESWEGFASRMDAHGFVFVWRGPREYPNGVALLGRLSKIVA